MGDGDAGGQQVYVGVEVPSEEAPDSVDWERLLVRRIAGVVSRIVHVVPTVPRR